MKGQSRKPQFHVTAGLIWRKGRVLIARRVKGSHLEGLWEFPGGKQEQGESMEACLEREIKEELGLEIEVGQPIVTIKHSYTHFKITLHAFYCQLLNGQPQAFGVADWRWVTLNEIDTFPFPRTDLKIIEALKNKKPRI